MTIDCCAFCDTRVFGAVIACDRCFKRLKGHPEEVRQVMEALTNIICGKGGDIIKNPTRYKRKRKCQWCNDIGRLQDGSECPH